MDTFEIQDENIDVKKILKKIRKNIKTRGNIASLDYCATTSEKSLKLWDNIYDDWAYLNRNWDITNEKYIISSHRPVIGKILVQGRKLLDKLFAGESKRYVDHIAVKQNYFNGSVVRLVNGNMDRFNFLDKEIDELRYEYNKNIINLRLEFNSKLKNLGQNSDILDTYKMELSNKELELNYNINNLKAEFNSQIEQIRTNILNNNIQYFNNLSSNKIDSSDELDKYFKNCTNLIKISYKDNSIVFDFDAKQEIILVQEDTFMEKNSNIFILISNYFNKFDDGSLKCIFLENIVEYLKPTELIQIFNICKNKMQINSNFMIQSMNPLSYMNLKNQSTNCQSVNPINPETINYLLQSAKFLIISNSFVDAYINDNDFKLKKIEHKNQNDTDILEIIDVYNHNIDKLNNILFAHTNYLIIAKKGDNV